MQSPSTEYRTEVFTVPHVLFITNYRYALHVPPSSILENQHTWTNAYPLTHSRHCIIYAPGHIARHDDGPIECTSDDMLGVQDCHRLRVSTNVSRLI
jgi:hypothetical protein